MKKVVKLFASVFCLAYFIGCATIIRGTSQTITINSNVSGASIELNGAPVGVTPFTGKIKKDKEDKILTILKQGYITQNIVLEKEFDWIIAGGLNLITNSGIGTTTDLSTGAAWLYSPNTYFVQLQKEGQSDWGFQSELYIRKFAMINHSQIAIDAGKTDGGEYTDALADLMKSKMDKETAMLNIQEALEKSKGDQIIFGNELIESFRN